MRLSLLVAAIVSTFALVQPASGQTSNAVVTSSPGKVGVAQTVDFTATISAIDKATRTITLKGPKGDEQKVVAGPEVKNFDQLKVGDVVQAQYLESLVLELKKGGGLAVAKTEKSGGVAAKPGERPAGAAGRQVTIVGNVIKVDAATQKVTLKGPERTVDLKVRDPEQFKLIAVGDQIEATYTEAIAVAVTPAAKPADKAAPKK
jgi:DNA-binding beta-propeller fold protein YncE